MRENVPKALHLSLPDPAARDGSRDHLSSRLCPVPSSPEAPGKDGSLRASPHAGVLPGKAGVAVVAGWGGRPHPGGLRVWAPLEGPAPEKVAVWSSHCPAHRRGHTQVPLRAPAPSCARAELSPARGGGLRGGGSQPWLVSAPTPERPSARLEPAAGCHGNPSPGLSGFGFWCVCFAASPSAPEARSCCSGRSSQPPSASLPTLALRVEGSASLS